MSTFVPGPRPVTGPPPGRPTLAGWALGLTLAGPAVVVLAPLLPPLAGGVVSLLALPAVVTGLALGIAALVRSARTGGRGRGLAIAAVLTAASIVVVTVLFFGALLIIFSLGGGT